MPGWHEATKEFQAQGKVQMVGIILEQHPDRCALFMQWKQMDWPIMVDALNLLQLKAVPLTYLIDEHGIVKAQPRRPDEVEAWLNEPPPDGEAPVSIARTQLPTLQDLHTYEQPSDEGDLSSLVDFANTLFMWGDDKHARHAVDVYEKLVHAEPDNQLLHFYLGVAHRKSFDVDTFDEEDFIKAVEHWQIALNADPNQYIWRRRIQQYGPRLMKPYPFYDWVPKAREEIKARGETPVELVVEPSGAEFAQPERSFSVEEVVKENPDPEALIDRDELGFIDVKIVVVPSEVKPGGAVRVHVLMTPNTDTKVKAHWNNEADDTVLWIDPLDAWQVDRRWLSAKRPETIVSTETRRIEFELHLPDDAKAGVAKIPAYALYYVCEDVSGLCLYRRQDLEIKVNVVK